MFHPRGPSLSELIRQALCSTERGYDLLAPKFDYTPFRTPDVILAAAASLIGAEHSVPRGIDLCCGTGAAMGMLLPLCRDEVVGVDFSEGMLGEARRRLAGASPPPAVRLLKADVCELTVDEPFDVATCFGALGHVPADQEDAFAAAVARILRPGGRFVFATAVMPSWYSARALLSRGFNAAMAVRNALWSPPFVMVYLRFTLPGVVQLLERHGFSCSVVEGALPGPLGAVAFVVATRR